MSNDYDLESQIGSIGGEQTTNLGKLQHLQLGQEKLTEEEEASKQAFLNKTRNREDYSQDIDRIADGWIPVNRSEMGIRSMFYPEDWEFRIRPAEVEAIKNWSAIDENDIAVTNNVFNEIMKACVSIKTPSGKLPWSKVNSWDRFWFILMIRKYTFINGESKISYDEECPECGETIYYDLCPENLVYEFPDDDIVEKHWNKEDRTWYINPKEYDLDRPMQQLYVPTLEKDEAILQWAYSKAQEGKTLNATFLKFLPWLLKKASKDGQVLENQIKEAQKVFKSWDTEMFGFMNDVLKNIIINPSEKLKQICPNCGEEVQSAVRFPNGISSLFAIQSGHRKFGSK